MYNTSKKDYQIIKQALNDSNVCVEDYLAAADKSKVAVSKDVAEELYGKSIPVSATKFDTFHRCKFKFFCNYGLGVKKIEAADFNVLQRGTIVHYVLENIIKEHGKNIASFSREECDALSDKYLNEYLNSVSGFADVANARIKFLVSKISIIIKDVVFHISKEFAQTDFNPEYCELKIGENKTVPELSLPFGDNGEIKINGSIDRLDVWNGYLRVVDYKTGTKNFKLSDILVGLNLQMLLYLYSIVRGNNEELSRLKPAGVLYMPSKREKEDSPLTMNGLVFDEERVYTAMEHENNGIFIPKHECYETGDKKGQTKGNTYVGQEVFDLVFDYIEHMLKNMGKDVLSGDSSAIPVDASGKKSCEYCDYYPICCLENGEHIKAPSLKNSEVIEKIKEEI